MALHVGPGARHGQPRREGGSGAGAGRRQSAPSARHRRARGPARGLPGRAGADPAPAGRDRLAGTAARGAGRVRGAAGARRRPGRRGRVCSRWWSRRAISPYADSASLTRAPSCCWDGRCCGAGPTLSAERYCCACSRRGPRALSSCPPTGPWWTWRWRPGSTSGCSPRSSRSRSGAGRCPRTAPPSGPICAGASAIRRGSRCRGRGLCPGAAPVAAVRFGRSTSAA